MNKLRFDRETNLVLRYYLYKKSEKTIYDLNYQQTLSFIDSLLLRNIFLFSFNVTRNTQYHKMTPRILNYEVLF